MVDQVLRLPEGTAAAAARAAGRATARASTPSCSRTSPARASCACASTGASTRWTRCRSSTRRRKHTIEAVVDRMRVRADAAQRLAESFETALRLSGGLARLAFLDEPEREELVFSSRHACPVCGYSVPPLEPKLFSFNNPAGACPTCDGLGVQGVLRSAARGAASAPVARRRRGARLGPAQRALLPADPVARPALRLRHRDALDRAARARAARAALRQRRRGDRVPLHARRGHAQRASAIRSRASCRTSSAATARPSRRRCARSWRKYLGHAPVPGLPRHAPQPRGALRVRRRPQRCPRSRT